MLKKVARIALFALGGAVSLIIFSLFQKKLMGVAFTPHPRANIVPVLFGGASGLFISLWREKSYEATRQLRESEERHRTVSDFSSDLIYWQTPDGRLRYVSPASTTICGHPPEAFYADPSLLERIIHPDDLSLWEGHVGPRDREAHERIELRLLTATGDIRWVSHICRPVFSTTGAYLGRRGSHSDITETKNLAGRVSHLERYDALTALVTRTNFEVQLEQALAAARRGNRELLLFTLGLDQFQLVNDSLGHAVGDTVLRTIANRLRELFDDDCVCRQGGDVFSVLVCERGKGEAALLAEEMLAKVRSPLAFADGPLTLGASIGIAVFPGDGLTALDLLRNAETAMYRAKEKGRNGFQFYAAAMNERARDRLHMLTLMREGLTRGEFSLVYQLQYRLESGQVSGCEALMRWNSPELGSVSPGSFIPLAEEAGLIHELGDLALQQGCRQCHRWQDDGFNLRVAVNVSALQFLQAGFVDTVEAALTESGLEPEALELELTESVLMRDPDLCVARLQRLKELGVQLAIDDFGTGYSSLSYLSRLPIDRLKIDRAFIQNLDSGSGDEAITEAILALGRGLKLEVVAEGIESEEQLDFFVQRGCDEGQGFFFSRPQTADIVTALLRAEQGMICARI